MRLYYDKGARENEEDNHVKEDEVKHSFRPQKEALSNLTFPHTTCCLLHRFLEVRLNEGCLKDGKRRYRFVPISERDEVET